MDRKYRRLALTDRISIGHLKTKGLNQSQIAKLLGVNRSTICRELKRNHDPIYGYHILLAHENSKTRQLVHRSKKINRNEVLKDYILEKMKEGWSPEQIAGRSKLVLGETMVSHETIYQYVFSPEGIKDGLYKYLRTRIKRRYSKSGRIKRKRNLIPNRVSIHERPEIINNRESYGHWEADLIVFSQDKKINCLTLRKRKSRFMIVIKNENRRPSTITANLFAKCQLYRISPFKSITFDNDISFLHHQAIAKKFGTQTYFCDAYKSYQKGSIENGNRSLREYFPRKIDMRSMTQNDINHYVNLVNTRPMKCLGFKTPDENYREWTYHI